MAVTISDIERDRALNIHLLKYNIADLHPILEESLKSSRKLSRDADSRGERPKFSEGDFVLDARYDFTAGEKLFLR